MSNDQDNGDASKTPGEQDRVAANAYLAAVEHVVSTLQIEREKNPEVSRMRLVQLRQAVATTLANK